MSLYDLVKRHYSPEEKYMARDGVQIGAEVVGIGLSSTLSGVASGWSAAAHLGIKKLATEENAKTLESVLGVGVGASFAFNVAQTIFYATFFSPTAIYNAAQAGADAVVLRDIYVDLSKFYGSGIFNVTKGALIETIRGAVKSKKKDPDLII